MNTRSILLSLTALAISLIFSVLAAEGLLRILGFESSLVYRPDPNYGWGHTPNAEFDWKTGNDSREIRINSLGLRDNEIPYAKTPGAKRLLVLGDSFSEAFQVSIKERFSNLLGQSLARDSRRPGMVEVINAGASGYGTDNALLFFRHEGVKYQPDIVVLAIYVGNDIRNNWYPLENLDAGGFRKPYFELIDGQLEAKRYPFLEHSSFPTRLKLMLNRNLVLYSFIREMRDRFRHSGQQPASSAVTSVPLDMQIYLANEPEEWNAAYAVTSALLSQLNQEVSAVGASLRVVLIPSRLQVHAQDWDDYLAANPALAALDWDLERPTQRLVRILSEQSIPTLDLLSSFRAAAARERVDLYIEGDGHWNAAGHRVAAETLLEYLSSSNDLSAENRAN